MESINNNGFLLLKNILTPEQLEYGLSSDNNGVVNYQLMKNFIDNIFIPTISSNTEFMPDPKYVKFRYSNNNNSKDASTFHSDVYNYSSTETIPIYTCLCYFDNTQLEVIPGSHKKAFRDNNISFTSYFKKIRINMGPGDILIFNSNLYHRGVDYKTKGDRRVLQVFDVFPDKKAFYDNYNNFLTVITSKNSSVSTIGNILYNVAKVPFLMNIISYTQYILVFNDLQYKVILNDLTPCEKINKLISYESSKRLEYKNITGSDPNNLFIICENSNTTELSYYYFFFYLVYWLVIFSIIYYSSKWIYKKIYK